MLLKFLLFLYKIYYTFECIFNRMYLCPNLICNPGWIYIYRWYIRRLKSFGTVCDLLLCDCYCRSLCLSTDEAFNQGKILPFINPSSLETFRALVEEIQSSGETDPEIWKDCEVGKTPQSLNSYRRMWNWERKCSPKALKEKLVSSCCGSCSCALQLAASFLSCHFFIFCAHHTWQSDTQRHTE